MDTPSIPPSDDPLDPLAVLADLADRVADLEWLVERLAREFLLRGDAVPPRPTAFAEKVMANLKDKTSPLAEKVKANLKKRAQAYEEAELSQSPEARAWRDLRRTVEGRDVPPDDEASRP